MIFSELYSAYYNAVAAILKAALDHPLEKNELCKIATQHAFSESVLNIEPAITDMKWQLLKEDGTTPIIQAPSMPLTILQKRWLKAISLDPRIKLFHDDKMAFPDVEPLFTKEDYCIFDKYEDGDPYEDEKYQLHFKLILDAIKKKDVLDIEMRSRSGGVTRMLLLPQHLEYSEKDDKFRLIGAGWKYGGTVNLGRIISCKRFTGTYVNEAKMCRPSKQRKIILELTDERNALERVMMHFAHFAKQAEKTGENTYKITIDYDKEDETEMVIRILSFGPMIKVVAPVHFKALIKERLSSQMSCGL